jgi:hypothetical protein
METSQAQSARWPDEAIRQTGALPRQPSTNVRGASDLTIELSATTPERFRAQPFHMQMEGHYAQRGRELRQRGRL